MKNHRTGNSSNDTGRRRIGCGTKNRREGGTLFVARGRNSDFRLLLSFLVVLTLEQPRRCEGFSSSAIRGIPSTTTTTRMMMMIQCKTGRTSATSLWMSNSNSTTTAENAKVRSGGSGSTTTSEGHSIRIEKSPFKSNKNSRSKQPPPSKPLSKNQEALIQRTFPRTWVPLASAYELDPDRPTPLEFLGQKFVCYQQDLDDENSWIVMDDVCPHRLVPLSEGRVNRTPSEDSAADATTTLQCSYHGWEFSGDGQCVAIPQAEPSVAAQAMTTNRSAVTGYSTRVHKNVLWFWPWADQDALSLLDVYPKGHPEGIMASIANPPRAAAAAAGDDDDAPPQPSYPTTYTRDLPYGWDTLLENLIDPAHIPFAHHNLQGKRDDAIPISMTVPESLGDHYYSTSTVENNNHDINVGNNDLGGAKMKKGLGATGFLFEWQDRTIGKHRAGTGEFQAPYGIAYEGLFYATKEAADASRGSHIADKRSALGLADAATTATATSTHDDAKMTSSTTTKPIEPKDDDDDDLGPFKLGVLCIPTKPGWSRAIIFSGGFDATKAEPNKTTTTTTKRPKPKKRKKSIAMKIFGIVPPWVIHLLSNRFLDSDLAFLHHQEQERLRWNKEGNPNGYYYMPAEADRCVGALRRWIPKHTDYFAVEGDHLPPVISDRTTLFDRYHQHTQHCKHCQNGLAFLTTTARNTAWTGLVGSVLASHWLRNRWGLAAKLLALACAGILRLLAAIEPAFTVGGFDHYENH